MSAVVVDRERLDNLGKCLLFVHGGILRMLGIVPSASCVDRRLCSDRIGVLLIVNGVRKAAGL
jgi:hypothetical protein